MHPLLPAPSRLAASCATLALLLLATGCASDGDQPHPPRGAAHARHFPTMAGTETFFSGTITAEVLVGAMTGFEAGGAGGGPGGGGGRHHHGGGGGMHMGGGGGGGGDSPGGASEPESPGGSELRRADAMGSPPVMIHLRFTNQGTAKAEVIIADFLSPLGNFVVHPDTLSLEPGQSLEVEPMTSRLADELAGEITLTLKLGPAKETKTVALALKPAAAEPPPQH